MYRPSPHAAVLVTTILLLLFVVASSAVSQTTTVTDTVTLSFAEAGGIAALGLTRVGLSLSVSEEGTIPAPGGRYEVHVVPDGADAGRLRYTVHGQSLDMKIVVRTPDAVDDDALSVSVVTMGEGGGGDCGTAVSGPVYIGAVQRTLITGIGDCYTGTGSTDGALVKYTLHGNPGFSIGDVDVEYTLIAE